MYEVVLKLETYMKSRPVKRCYECRGSDSKPNQSSNKPNFENQPSRNPANVPPTFKDMKGKGVPSESAKQTNPNTCYKCHCCGHRAFECPTRKLYL